jgi:plastocyanin
MRLSFAAPFLLVALAACSQPSGDAQANAAAGGESSTATEAAAPAATGNVVEIKAITDDQGNRFEPATVTARQGDVLRLTLVSGVHNLSFPGDQNAGAANLPPASDMVQLPGQTVDIPVSMGAGTYTFQCDPHAALGMTGTLTVQ